MVRPQNFLTPLVVATLCLSACGGGTDSDSGAQTATPRGALLQSPPELLETVSSPALLLELNVLANQQLLNLSGTPICDILIYHIEYQTIGAAEEPATASAALMVPTGLGRECTGSRPILLYAHGTTTDRAFDMTNMQNAETLSLAALFASQGYIVVAPNYAGYDTSNLPYHPYLIAAQASADMIDALTAARTALPFASASLTKDDGRLFITGYSEGGYVALATDRALQSAGMPVTATAPMSGPYALAAFVDAIFNGEVNGGATISATLLLTSYQRAYGNIYTTPAGVFTVQYAAGIDSLLPSTTPRSQLYAEGRLPQFALFSATPPDPSLADITPATSPADLAAVFALGFGDGNLIQNAYRLRYVLDSRANPDGGWPATTTGVPAATPAFPWRQALKANDLRDWVPASPVMLCGGDLDPIVFWLNAQLMENYWTSHAGPGPAPTVLDLESAQAPQDPYATEKAGFALAKDLVAASAVAGGATDGGAFAVASSYHTTLVAPFCLAAVRSFFAAQ